MNVTSNGGEAFERLGRMFRQAGKDGAEIRKALTKEIQAELGTITREQKAMALGMKIRGTEGRGSLRRQAFREAAGLRGRRVRAAKGGYGLRAQVARGIKSKVSYSGRKLGARITVDTVQFPPSQRNLPKHLDSPRGWRHPVWGNRQNWVGQKGEPYFSVPIERHIKDVRAAIVRAVDNVLRRLT